MPPRRTGSPQGVTAGLPKRKEGRQPGGWSLVVIGEALLATHPLPKRGEVEIGRSDQADVFIDDQSVSRRHAVLRVGAALELEDLGSANGTRVGERALSPGRAVAVGVGDVVHIGGVMVVLQAAEAKPAAGGSADAALKKLHAIVERIAPGTINVLLLGETGVGKEVMAQHIHARSPRAKEPFVSVNCAALSETLLESELFGHDKGAFTGADQSKPGLLESAGKGTIFLDEVGELSPSLQAKLLRVLEDRQVRRVGGVKTQSIEARFVAATNRNLEEEVARGAFRKDLFYRLNGISLPIPPLRERRAEIDPLSRTFIAAASRSAGRAAEPALSPEAIELLARYDWPGNIRELRNLMERAVLLCDGPFITPEHLPAAQMTAPAAARATATDFHGEIEELERRRIVEALERCGGNQTRVAALLGISRGTLISRMNAYGLTRPRARSRTSR